VLVLKLWNTYAVQIKQWFSVRRTAKTVARDYCGSVMLNIFKITERYFNVVLNEWVISSVVSKAGWLYHSRKAWAIKKVDGRAQPLRRFVSHRNHSSTAHDENTRGTFHRVEKRQARVLSCSYCEPPVILWPIHLLRCYSLFTWERYCERLDWKRKDVISLNDNAISALTYSPSTRSPFSTFACTIFLPILTVGFLIWFHRLMNVQRALLLSQV